MRTKLFLFISFSIVLISCSDSEGEKTDEKTETATETPAAVIPAKYYIDVHDLEPGKVSFDDVMAAHGKDLATQAKYDVSFKKFWVDEKAGKVYCLSTAPNADSVSHTHTEAHGLTPQAVFEVSEGMEAKLMGDKPLFIDIHEMGEGKVTAADVAAAHEKDLAVQGKYGVNFAQYWVDPKSGTILCLSEAPNSQAVIDAHKEAHGLVPAKVYAVKQGE